MAYWNLFKEFDAIRRELDRMTPGDDWRMPFSKVSFLPALGARRYPMINMSEDKDNIYVEALAPGVDSKTLDISVLGGAVTISGEKISTTENVGQEAYHRCERATGKFVRSVELNSNVDEDRVTAEYKNGLIAIKLPKAESAKPKRIAITAGQ